MTLTTKIRDFSVTRRHPVTIIELISLHIGPLSYYSINIQLLTDGGGGGIIGGPGGPKGWPGGGGGMPRGWGTDLRYHS